MVDCATGEYGKSPYPNNGCNGGLMESAFTYSSQGFLTYCSLPTASKTRFSRSFSICSECWWIPDKSRVGYLPEFKYPYQGREQNCSLDLNAEVNLTQF